MGTFVPFRQFVLKVHSRCDLACDHCYMYEHADQSWRRRPRVMAEATVEQAVARIAEHVRAHDVREIAVVLHGGEPLLAGPAGLAAVAGTLRAGLAGQCAVDLRIHTNGVLLDRTFCEVFRRFRIRVGISLDGDRASNDRHRRRADGRGSYEQVVRGIDLVRQEIPELFAGLLCTVDVRNDPLAVYRELIRHQPPAIDFLLPHATWDSPPVRPAETAYADWLTRVYDAWRSDGRPVPIRMFDSVIRTAQGGSSLTESLGLEPSDLVVIETDGGFEQADSLKTAYDGAPATGYDVFTATLDAVATHPGMVARQRGTGGLSAICKQCPVVRSCGGGLYAHRYRSGTGFDNPSVYCADLFAFITHVQRSNESSMHIVSSGTLDLVASGYGHAPAIASLEEAQQTLRRALLASIPRSAETNQAWTVISEVDSVRRESLDAVLAHPFIRVWAAQSLRGGADATYLAAVGASSAIHAGMDARLWLPVRGGVVHLPAVGSWLVDKSLDRVRIDVHRGDYELAADGTLLPLRRLTANGASVVLDDLDPHRDCYGWPTASRLDDGELDAWQQTFREAWMLIERDYPAYVQGLAGGLSTIVPLARAEHGRNVSATARDAYGAVAVALPADPAALALLLIHEFQHVKLGAVLDLFDLCDPADTGLYYAPWRDDPRPLEGLLQGAYAHIAVADFWRIRYPALADSAAALAAAAAFVQWRDEVLDAIDTLSGSGALTELGQRFVTVMRRTVADWRDVRVPSAAVDMAAKAAREHRDSWLLSRARGACDGPG
jgi:uncharacterized protein